MTNIHYRNSIIAYINSGCLTKQDKAISILFPGIPFNLNAEKVSELYRNINKYRDLNQFESVNISVEKYSGDNTFVLQMEKFLYKHLKKELVGAYVHGSLGTYEESLFSDFDGLVILRKDVFSSPQRLSYVAKKLSEAQRIMFKFDPLQHHSWFILTEFDLKRYPEYYFPHELFFYAKSLFSDYGTKLNIRVPKVFKNTGLFINLANGIISHLNKKIYPKNMYKLKSLLSQFMLLPSLYVEARDNKGIFKKFSFESAKKDFDSSLWSIMEEVSFIRKTWQYDINLFQKLIMSESSFRARRLSKIISPKIPRDIKCLLTNKFYERMLDLAICMRETLR